MYQTELVELIKDEINTTFLPSKSLDPTAIESLAPQEVLLGDATILHVVPDMYDLDMNLTTRRKKIESLHSVKYVSVVYGKSYSGTDETDIGPWAESKVCLDLMEDLMKFLAKLDYDSLKIVSIEFVRVDDTALAHRRFLSSISIGFSEQC
jgi:hypothetical protein